MPSTQPYLIRRSGTERGKTETRSESYLRRGRCTRAAPLLHPHGGRRPEERASSGKGGAPTALQSTAMAVEWRGGAELGGSPHPDDIRRHSQGAAPMAGPARERQRAAVERPQWCGGGSAPPRCTTAAADSYARAAVVAALEEQMGGARPDARYGDEDSGAGGGSWRRWAR